jgi:tetratricopeptide (TPR) repeat protein
VYPETIDVSKRGGRWILAWMLAAIIQLGAPAAGAAEMEPGKIGRVDTTPKLEVLNKQIAANAEDSQAYANRGYTLALLGRKDEARSDIQRSVALKDNGPMHNRAGWAYFNLGDYAEALREFETAVKFSEHRAHYDYYSLVLGYWGMGKTKEALENYQLAVERDPRFGEFKTLNERVAEWTPQERRAIHEIYVLWSKTWKP